MYVIQSLRLPPLLDEFSFAAVRSLVSPILDLTEFFWGWITDLLVKWAERVGIRLLHSEQTEPLVWEREAYRMAYWIVGLCQDNCPDPFFAAFVRMYGQTPENLNRKIQQWRASMLRNELPPKKTPMRARAADAVTRKSRS